MYICAIISLVKSVLLLSILVITYTATTAVKMERARER